MTPESVMPDTPTPANSGRDPPRQPGESSLPAPPPAPPNPANQEE